MAIKMSGGLGRVVSALPALNASNQLVITEGWDELYTMTKLTRIESSSAFIGEALKNEDVITPEPYHTIDYRHGKMNLVESFNSLLGVVGTDYGLYPNPLNVQHWIKHFGEQTTQPIVVIQPTTSNFVKSMSEQNVKNCIKSCHELGYFPVIVGDSVPYNHDAYILSGTSVTDFVSIIAIGAYFIGGDSSGLHIARALGKTGILFLTSTSGIKFYDGFIEFRHPINNKSIETPRLFAGEITNNKENELTDFNYVVDVDDIKSSFNILNPNV